MAGGTGGHVYPALAVARALQAESREVVWLGTHRGLESRVVPAAGIDIEWISVKGLRRKGALALLVAPFQIGWALLQSLGVMFRRRPAAVLGMGGFVSGPGGVAAWLTRRPLVIHEQNAAAGLTNRLLARLARVVLQAFPGSFNSACRRAKLSATRYARTSPPSPRRPSVTPRARARCAARARWQPGRTGAESHGAGGAGLAGCRTSRPMVRHQCGERTLDEATAGVRRGTASTSSCCHSSRTWPRHTPGPTGDLPGRRADGRRALCAAGLPALFVPYPCGRRRSPDCQRATDGRCRRGRNYPRVAN